ncbi:MAG: alcohol dehydrogenase catalytic domain-containing protein, partial [Planctomycetes bacterium]|nr:alcohol dehydrogenase catalytic domain-containing protein [Planctomycetota bacterium]
MKAAVIESAGKLVVRDLDMPPVGEYEALCETQYGALCTGTDNHLLHARPPFCYWVKLPAILGNESIGKVVKLGAKVRNLKEGDLVARVGHPGANGVGNAWGGFAELTLARDWQAMRDDGRPEGEWKNHTVNQVLPAGVDAAQGTMFITWRETLSYMNRIGASQGKKVLVIGSGANGLSMANHAHNLGAEKVVLVGSSGRKQESLKVGCAAFVDYKAADGRAQALAVCPTGFDIAVDVVGSP